MYSVLIVHASWYLPPLHLSQEHHSWRQQEDTVPADGTPEYSASFLLLPLGSKGTSLPGSQRSGLITTLLGMFVGCEQWHHFCKHKLLSVMPAVQKVLTSSAATNSMLAASLVSTAMLPSPGFEHQNNLSWLWNASCPSRNWEENQGVSEENKQQTVSTGDTRTAITAGKTEGSSLITHWQPEHRQCLALQRGSPHLYLWLRQFHT